MKKSLLLLFAPLLLMSACSKEEFKESDNIVFCDIEAKAVCVERWDLNGDLEISYEEAASAIITNEFTRNERLKEFPEFKYFKRNTSISGGAFGLCRSLTSITLPEGVESIGNSAFQDCSSLTAITLPKNVTNIGDLAFATCDSLTSITIPKNVTSIGWRAFCECYSLKSVKVLAVTPPTVGDEAFVDCYSATLYVPEEAVSAYKNTYPWSEFDTILGFS